MDARSKDAEAGSKLRLVFEKQDLALNFKAGRDVLYPPPERQFSAMRKGLRALLQYHQCGAP